MRPLILPNCVQLAPAHRSPKVQRIPLANPEFKNISLSETTGSPKDQKYEKVIDQSKETYDFGATLNMSAQNLLESQKKDGCDDQKASAFDLSGISDETGRSKSDSHVIKMRPFISTSRIRFGVITSRLDRLIFHSMLDRFAPEPDIIQIKRSLYQFRFGSRKQLNPKWDHR